MPTNANETNFVELFNVTIKDFLCKEQKNIVIFIDGKEIHFAVSQRLYDLVSKYSRQEGCTKQHIFSRIVEEVNSIEC